MTVLAALTTAVVAGGVAGAEVGTPPGGTGPSVAATDEDSAVPGDRSAVAADGDFTAANTGSSASGSPHYRTDAGMPKSVWPNMRQLRICS
ncbi:hypothetical protein [Nocardia sp. BMG51109]|uniref:hypothetical protein n=1 Tax=Nocardia sp. BMG51109 TaxID=1056816 RepID=UPI000464BF41|nr:hypothetical protein [Nocardia sp. BMG51109]